MLWLLYVVLAIPGILFFLTLFTYLFFEFMFPVLEEKYVNLFGRKETSPAHEERILEGQQQIHGRDAALASIEKGCRISPSIIAQTEIDKLLRSARSTQRTQI